MVLAELGDEPCEVIWIDKGVCLWPETIRRCRKLAKCLVYYTPDTSFLANSSRFFDATISLYDLVVTTKSLEVQQFEKRIPQDRLLLVTQSFDPRIHRPTCGFEEKHDGAVFIGLCEPDRERCVDRLLGAGVPVRIGGCGWDRFVERRKKDPLLHFAGSKVFGEHYVKALSSAQIGLGLLTKRFPELHTTRTLEIPACGTALATERNTETKQIFSDDEAIFFADYRDLASQVVELLSMPERLKGIAASGHRKVWSGDFTNADMVRRVLKVAGVSFPATAAEYPETTD